jgi:hypothetical protein
LFQETGQRPTLSDNALAFGTAEVARSQSAGTRGCLPRPRETAKWPQEVAHENQSAPSLPTTAFTFSSKFGLPPLDNLHRTEGSNVQFGRHCKVPIDMKIKEVADEEAACDFTGG